MRTLPLFTATLGLCMLTALPQIALAQTFTFSTGAPDRKIATTSRPASSGKIETETADDFLLSGTTQLKGATFTGLLPKEFAVKSADVEIYRVFPMDSTDPPSGNVPTRVNSPSDVVHVTRQSRDSSLSFTTTTLNTSFTAANSVETESTRCRTSRRAARVR